jgi:hypothetical protein
VLLNKHHALKAYWGSGCIAPCILEIGNRGGVSCQLHGPAALSKGKSRRYPLDRRLGGPQSRSGRDGEEKNSQPLSGLKPLIIQPVAQRYSTELSKLLNRTNITDWNPLSNFGDETCGRTDCPPQYALLLLRNAFILCNSCIRTHQQRITVG